MLPDPRQDMFLNKEVPLESVHEQISIWSCHLVPIAVSWISWCICPLKLKVLHLHKECVEQYIPGNAGSFICLYCKLPFLLPTGYLWWRLDMSRVASIALCGILVCSRSYCEGRSYVWESGDLMMWSRNNVTRLVGPLQPLTMGLTPLGVLWSFFKKYICCEGVGTIFHH